LGLRNPRHKLTQRAGMSVLLRKREYTKLEKIKAIVFDVDGTLINRRIAFQSICEELISRYIEEYPYQGTVKEIIDYMIEIDGNGYGGIKKFIPKLQTRWKIPLTTEEFIQERNKIFGKLTVPMPDLNEVLDTLKKKYRLGIITNGYSTVQREKVEMVGIQNYFDDIIVSGETDFAKPDPQIFLLSCKHLELNPEEMVYVGDYYPNDIAGAISANIKPIWINEDPDEYKEYKGIRITELKELLQHL